MIFSPTIFGGLYIIYTRSCSHLSTPSSVLPGCARAELVEPVKSSTQYPPLLPSPIVPLKWIEYATAQYHTQIPIYPIFYPRKGDYGPKFDFAGTVFSI